MLAYCYFKADEFKGAAIRMVDEGLFFDDNAAYPLDTRCDGGSGMMYEQQCLPDVILIYYIYINYSLLY